MYLKALLLVAAVAASLATQAQSITERAAKDEGTRMNSEEPAMRKAFSRAAATLPEFLRLASHPKEGTDGYALKVAISDGKNTEYFWVGDFTNQGNAFTAVLNNEPRLVKKHKAGDRIRFTRAQIADWMYLDLTNKKMVGNFTACALLTKEPPEQAAEFKRLYKLTCED